MSNSSCHNRRGGCARAAHCGCSACQNNCSGLYGNCSWDSCGCSGWDTCGCSGNWGGCNGIQHCSHGADCGCQTCAGHSCGCSSCNCNSCGSWPLTPPPAPGSMIVPRVIASGRAIQRGLDASFCAEDLPDTAVAPYTLLSVTAANVTDWEYVNENSACMTIRATLRLQLQIRDANCCLYTAHTTITVDVPLHSAFPNADHWRTHVFVLPNVRLTCAPVCSDTDCFDVRLDVAVDVFLVRWEPSADGVTIPCRPDLPLTLPSRSFGPCCR